MRGIRTSALCVLNINKTTVSRQILISYTLVPLERFPCLDANPASWLSTLTCIACLMTISVAMKQFWFNSSNNVETEIFNGFPHINSSVANAPMNCSTIVDKLANQKYMKVLMWWKTNRKIPSYEDSKPLSIPEHMVLNFWVTIATNQAHSWSLFNFSPGK
jgi:hypothetical protein